MLPDWVREPAPARQVRRTRSWSGPRRFLQESAVFLERTFFAEEAARRPGLLQRLEARAKLGGVVALLVIASFLRHLPSLWLIGAFALAALLVSRVPPRTVFHRAVWAAPALFALAALPAMLSPFTPGRALLVLYHTPSSWSLALPREIAITAPGAAGVALFVSRIGVSLLLALMLTLTTRTQGLLRAAHTSATAPFVAVAAMAHRYLFLLLHTAEELHLARRARTVTPPAAREARQWAGRSIAFLFTRSRRLMEEIHLAMLARGYTGTPRTLTTSRFTAAEAVWLLICTAVAVGAVLLDRTILGGLAW